MMGQAANHGGRIEKGTLGVPDATGSPGSLTETTRSALPVVSVLLADVAPFVWVWR